MIFLPFQIRLCRRTILFRLLHYLTCAAQSFIITNNNDAFLYIYIIIGVTFSIKKFNNIPATGCVGLECHYLNTTINTDVSKVLDLFSQSDHSDYCLAYLFLYREFSPTLGLAYRAACKYFLNQKRSLKY